jgi:osmotically inducible protein OsmC
MSKRVASARWEGNLKEGKGSMSTASGAFKGVPFSFRTRFEEAPGTNPEEMIGAAQAGCFSMALSAGLADKGMTPQSVDTTATVTLEPVDGKPTVTGIHLDVVAKIPGGDDAKFQAIAAETKEQCPISRLLKPGTKITMNARLEA